MRTINKVILTLLFVFTTSFWAVGQSMYGDKVNYDVKMKYVNTLDEAMKRAKAEKKLIFFNCFADWALPCHGMNKHVFSNQEFCDYMNKTFVNLLMDVSTRENSYVAQKYKIDFFAHYLVLDSEGKIIHRITGGRQAEEFKEMIKQSLSPKTSLVGMNKSFEEGNRNRDFLRNYAKVLIPAQEGVKGDSVIQLYLAKTKKTEMAKSENWFIVNRLSAGVGSEWFEYVVANKEAFVKGNGLKLIDAYISGAYTMALLPYVMDNKGYTLKKINDITIALENAGIPRDNKTYLYLELAKARGEKHYSDYVNILRTRGSEIDGVVIDNVMFSVANMSDASAEDMKNILAFLSEKEAESEGSQKKRFQSAIAGMTSTSGIKFEDGTFADALKKAKDENKLLFLDAYTSWCGPCQTMAKQVFTLERIGEYFDKNFIAIKIDMEKGEGIELAKKYNISVYPTMTLLNAEGKEMHRVIGACSPAEFVRKLEVGRNPETCLANVRERYDAGDRTPLLVCNYIQAMEIAGEMKNGKLKAEEFFFTLPKVDQINANMLPMFRIYATKSTDRMTTFLMDNKAAYDKIIPSVDLDALIERIYFPELLGMIKSPDAANDTKLLVEKLEKAKLSSKSVLGLFVRLTRLSIQKDVDGIINVYKKDVAVMDTNPQGKLNIDMLLPIYMKDATPEQQIIAKNYIQEQSQKADSRAKNGYGRILNEL